MLLTQEEKDKIALELRISFLSFIELKKIICY
jgi:hypothetical protein